MLHIGGLLAALILKSPKSHKKEVQKKLQMKTKSKLALFSVFVLCGCRHDEPIPVDYVSENQTNWTKQEIFSFETCPECATNEKFCEFSFFDIYFEGQIGYVCGNYSVHETQARLFKTTDGGLTWSVIYDLYWGCGAGSFEEGMIFITPDHGLVAKICHYVPQIVETFDGGATWEFSENYVDINIDYNITCKVDDTHFIVDQIRSSDGGATWDSFNKISGTTCYDFIDSSYGICATSSGIIAQTFDFGMTWDTIYNNPSDNFYCVKVKDNNTLFAGGTTLIKTDDNGTNWQEVYSTPQIRDIKFVDNNIGFAATHNGGTNITNYYGDILKTTDGGNTWSINYHSDFMSFNEIFIIDEMTQVACGNQTDNYTHATGTYFIKTTTQGN